MLIRLIKYHPLYAYSVGDEFEVNEEHTQILLDGKYAEPVGSSQKADGEKPEPELPRPEAVETPESHMPEPEKAEGQKPSNKKNR
jgi:hypothetical protein